MEVSGTSGQDVHLHQAAKKNVIRKLYDWVLNWAESPYGAYALFFLAFAESSFFPIPPDVLLIALTISMPARAFRFALICTVGSLIGGLVGYGIGHFGYETIGSPIVEFYNGEAVMESIKQQYDELGFWGVLIAAVTPIPYKIFTISAGVFRFSFSEFMLASIIGRSLRFFAVAGLIWRFGPSIKTFIDRYFNLLATLFVILLIGGFILVKFAADQ